VGAALLCAAALGAGCGDDDPQPSDTGAESAPDTTRETEAEQSGPGDGAGGGAGAPAGGGSGEKPAAGGSPEDQPGGAGDEIPARSQALVTGRDGRLSPRLVRVPPFISVRVRLRSSDGAEYRLAGAGKTITAGGGTEAVSADFDGLRPGRKLVLEGPQGRVVVEASAEPGP
jgi:hypothetical protein